MPGFGMPATPHDLKVATRDGATVRLDFEGGEGAANYRAWIRNVNNASDFSKPDLTVANSPCIGVTFLFPGAWNYEFCVTALNGRFGSPILLRTYADNVSPLPGNLESPRSNCVIASKDVTPNVGDCPASAQDDCGWDTPGSGGDGSGQPGVPGEPGSGMTFDSICSEDRLDRNWQRLILTHLEEKKHLGILTGSEITDMKITLASGKAHLKHTEGGDFRQATYRAVRHGLKRAESVLLEPVYEFRLELPSDMVGRAMTDIQKMHGRFQPPIIDQDRSILTGIVPVATMRNYLFLGGRDKGPTIFKPPLSKGPKVGDCCKVLSRLMDYRQELLTLFALLHVLYSIFLYIRPPVPL